MVLTAGNTAVTKMNKSPALMELTFTGIIKQMEQKFIEAMPFLGSVSKIALYPFIKIIIMLVRHKIFFFSTHTLGEWKPSLKPRPLDLPTKATRYNLLPF